jgi:hypothetical protein
MRIRHNSNSCVEEFPATIDGESQHSFNSISLPRAEYRSKNKCAEPTKTRPTFMEEFLFEHSRYGLQADSIESVRFF